MYFLEDSYDSIRTFLKWVIVICWVYPVITLCVRFTMLLVDPPRHIILFEKYYQIVDYFFNAKLAFILFLFLAPLMWITIKANRT